MAFAREKVVDLIAKNLREPKGLTGLFVLRFLQKYNEILISNCVKQLEVQPDHKILEVGFGHGVGLNAALEKVQHGSGKVYGIDISELAVDQAKTNFKTAIGRKKLEICSGSVMELPFPENFFDRVFHVNSYYYWSNLDQGISELKRVMKPKGLMITALVLDRKDAFVNSGLLRYGPYWCPDNFMEKLTHGGFLNVTMESLRAKGGFKFELIYASC